MSHPPKSLQHVLWSADVDNLDLTKDAPYIIHQIFSYGSLQDIAWLFDVYPKDTLVQIFTTTPYKDYFAARFHLIKNYVLGLEKHGMDERYYVKNTPRAL
jgi:hypothetical protein